MKQLYHILILEDNPADAELVIRELKKSGVPCTFTHVDTKNDFIRELEEHRPALILSDYKLPTYDGLSALSLASEKYSEIPFIFVSGTLGEENAIEALTHGATDYVLKDRLAKLGSAVVRALDDSEEKAARRELEQEMIELQEKYSLINENVIDTIWLMDMNFVNTFISPSVTRLRGYTLEELRSMPLEKNLTPESLKGALAVMAAELTPEKLEDKNHHLSKTLELEFNKKDGSKLWTESTITLLRGPDGTPTGFLGVGRDISERKAAETALRKSEKRFRLMIESIGLGIGYYDLEGELIYFNNIALGYMKGSSGDFIGQSVHELFGSEFGEVLMRRFNLVAGSESVDIYEDFVDIPAGKSWFRSYYTSVLDNNGNVIGVQIISDDITERKQAEEELQSQLKELQRWHDIMVDREDRMQELKKEVNDLLKEAGRPAKYRG